VVPTLRALSQHKLLLANIELQHLSLYSMDNGIETDAATMDDAADEGGSIELVENSRDQVEPFVGSSDNDSPTAHHHPTGTASNPQVAINIAISFLGSGMLGIPFAMMRAGWLLGSLALITTSGLNLYGMLLLPKVRRALQQRIIRDSHHDKDGIIRDDHQQDDDHTTHDCNTYGGMGRILLGPVGETFVNCCLMVSQLGFATAYLIFIADSLQHVARWKICFGCVPGLALLVQARDMSLLSPFSLAANLANLVGLSAVLWQDAAALDEREQEQAEEHVVHAIQWGGLVYVMAITLYSMEGVGLILSLETSCRNTAEFPWLLSRVITGITLFMCLFGSVSYAAFGSDTLAPITLNLGQSRAAALVQGALCVALYLTYPVMMFPVWTICEERILHTTNPAIRVVVRIGVVVLTAVVAYTTPDFGDYLSLVGSSLCIILAFLLPCYFHLALFGKELSWYERAFNYFLIVGGTLFGIVGTVQSFESLMTSEEEVMP
jgi:proton-coupled amino acid transporter